MSDTLAIGSLIANGLKSFTESYRSAQRDRGDRVAQEEQRAMARRAQKMQEREKGLLWNEERGDFEQDPIGTGNIQAKRQMDAAKDYFDTLKSQYSVLDEDQKYSPEGQAILKEMNGAASQLSALQRRMMGAQSVAPESPFSRTPDQGGDGMGLVRPQAQPSPVVKSGVRPSVNATPATGILTASSVPQKTRAQMKDQRAIDKAVQQATAIQKATGSGATELRKEFIQLPTTKQMQDVGLAFDKIQSAAKDPSAAGDLSVIFAYMKMLDPNSTVREGEQASAQNAGGVGDKVMNTYNRVLTGQRLTPSQREDFVSRAAQVYNSHQRAFSKSRVKYEGLANRRGFDPLDVVDAFEYEPYVSPQDKAAIEWAKKNPNDPRATEIKALHGF